MKRRGSANGNIPEFERFFFMNSTAHELSKDSVIDPVYSATRVQPEIPPSRTDYPWICGESEYVCYRLAELRANVKSARLRVGYPGEFRAPSRKAFFRGFFPGGEASFSASGVPVLSRNGSRWS